MKTPSWPANLGSTHQEPSPILTWTEPKAVRNESEKKRIWIFLYTLLIIALNFLKAFLHKYFSHEPGHLVIPQRIILLIILISASIAYFTSFIVKRNPKTIYLYEDFFSIPAWKLPLKDILFFNISPKNTYYILRLFTVFGATPSFAIPDLNTVDRINTFLIRKGFQNFPIDSFEQNRPNCPSKLFRWKATPTLLKWKEPKEFRQEIIRNFIHNRQIRKMLVIAIGIMTFSFLITKQLHTPHHFQPDNLISDACISLGGSFFIVCFPLILLYMLNQTSISENGILTGTEYHYFKTLTYYCWSNANNFSRLHIYNTSSKSITIGVPNSALREQINALLREKGLSELVLNEVCRS